MTINQGSKIEDIKEAVKGTWSVSTDNGWKCVELGAIKLYRKLCQKGINVLPSKFLQNREDVVGYMAFTKDNVTGGVIGVQDQAITLESNALVIIINI